MIVFLFPRLLLYLPYAVVELRLRGDRVYHPHAVFPGVGGSLALRCYHAYALVGPVGHRRYPSLSISAWQGVLHGICARAVRIACGPVLPTSIRRFLNSPVAGLYSPLLMTYCALETIYTIVRSLSKAMPLMLPLLTDYKYF